MTNSARCSLNPCCMDPHNCKPPKQFDDKRPTSLKATTENKEIARLRGLVIHYADQCGVTLEEL